MSQSVIAEWHPVESHIFDEGDHGWPRQNNRYSKPSHSCLSTEAQEFERLEDFRSNSETSDLQSRESQNTSFVEIYKTFVSLANHMRGRISRSDSTMRRLVASIKASHSDEGHSVKRFLGNVYKSLREQEIDRTIDLVFEEFDHRLCMSDFEWCAQVLRSVELQFLDSNLVVAFLVITLPAKANLAASRHAFFIGARRSLLCRYSEEEVDQILKGLS